MTTKKKEPHFAQYDYPDAIAEDRAFIDNLLDTHPHTKRCIPVQNIHEHRVYNGIEPQRYGIVSHLEHASAFGWLKKVNLIKEEAKA